MGEHKLPYLLTYLLTYPVHFIFCIESNSNSITTACDYIEADYTQYEIWG